MGHLCVTPPSELDWAAARNACKGLGVLWLVRLQLSEPAPATVTVLTFMCRWTGFMTALIYVSTVPKPSIALGLHNFQEFDYTRCNYPMVAWPILELPCRVGLFLALSYFTQGIALTGMKG